jgi:hypothetical protein
MNLEELAAKLITMAKAEGAVEAGDTVVMKLDGETVTTTA